MAGAALHRLDSSRQALDTYPLVAVNDDEGRAQAPRILGELERWSPADPTLVRPLAAIRQAFGSGWPFALCVATAESGLNPHAVGAQGELGIFQLHPRGWLPGYLAWSEVDDVTDVEDTSRYVAQRVTQEGWGDFSGARGC